MSVSIPGEELDPELYEIMATPQEVLKNCEAYLVRLLWLFCHFLICLMQFLDQFNLQY